MNEERNEQTPTGLESVLGRLRSGKRTRIVGFGSSNTEARNGFRFNWLDWLDTGLKSPYGRVHHTINAGIGGETTRELLARFDEDVAHYDPHLVFVTIGGNDSSPGRTMDESEYRSNLSEVGRLVCSLDQATLVYQTYYGCDLEKLEPSHAEKLPRFMQIIREVAKTQRALLVDHYARWELLRRHDVERYRQLMADPMHVNPAGNMVMGFDLARLFGVDLTVELPSECEDALRMQTLMDELQQRNVSEGGQ